MASNHSYQSDARKDNLAKATENASHISVNGTSKEPPNIDGQSFSEVSADFLGWDVSQGEQKYEHTNENPTENYFQTFDVNKESKNGTVSACEHVVGQKYKDAAEELKDIYGYEFRSDGRLFHTVIGEPFKFEVSPDERVNQETYKSIGKLADKYVFQLLEKNPNSGDKYACDLVAMGVPEGDESGTCIFVSQNFLFINCDKLLVLIHGAGAVRAGQWSRRLIINESLDHGTQIPYIKKWMSQGAEYGVLLMNTNERTGKIRSPYEHASYVWEHYVKQCKAKKIAIVAHSAGGVVVTKLISRFTEDFKTRVYGIAFTDSVHDKYDISNSSYFNKVACNWVCSNKPLNTVLYKAGSDCELRSAGTGVHEETSYKAIESVFNFIGEIFEKRWDQKTKKQSIATRIKNAIL